MEVLRNTHIAQLDDDRTVLLKGVGCTGQKGTEQPTLLRGVDMSFHLATPKGKTFPLPLAGIVETHRNHTAAEEFVAKLEDMKMELFVMYLKGPRPGERPLLKL